MPAAAPATGDAPLLSIRNLSIALPAGGDRAYAVRDVSYDIRAGEILCIVGESGSGKSMSANAIMGLLPDYLTPQQGSILFRGADLLRQDEASLQAMRGKDMAMIFQEPLSALNPLMTVGEQISEVMRVHDAYPGPARLARAGTAGLRRPARSGHAVPRLSVPPVRRPAPARDDRHGAGAGTGAADRRRAHHRAGRDHAGADPGADCPHPEGKGMGVMFVTHDFGVVAEIAHRVAVMEKACWSNRGRRTRC